MDDRRSVPVTVEEAFTVVKSFCDSSRSGSSMTVISPAYHRGTNPARALDEEQSTERWLPLLRYQHTGHLYNSPHRRRPAALADHVIGPPLTAAQQVITLGNQSLVQLAGAVTFRRKVAGGPRHRSELRPIPGETTTHKG